jgi:pimeloyl-ACP methyl ester carboxylesterase
MLLLARLRMLALLSKAGGEGSLPPILKHLPPDLSEIYLAVGFQSKTFAANLAEFGTIAKSDAQVRGVGFPRSIPLTVVRHGIPDIFASMPPAEAARAELEWQKLQGELAALSDRSRLIVAEKSGHAIQIHQPELVVETIRELVDQARRTS